MDRKRVRACGAGMAFVYAALCGRGDYVTRAADHLDTPTVIADPAADIGDLFAWTSSDGRRLNLVMDIVGHRFSDRLQYVFHVDSGPRFGKTSATTSILCRFDAANEAECWAGDADYVRGDASKPLGIEGRKKRFRVFAGLRDDPFFNNVKGTRAAYVKAESALKAGAAVDAAGCPRFDAAMTQAILEEWRHTDGGPATNFLAGWKASSLVVSIDLDVVDTGGALLAVWAGVHKAGEAVSPPTAAISPRPVLGAQIERMGRALTGNALLATFAPDEVSDQRKEAYNRAVPEHWAQFEPDIARGLALYDGFDGTCGNQWLADRRRGAGRYGALARLLADDRLWIDSKATMCTQYLAVERGVFAGAGSPSHDCGGRTPNYDAIDVFRSLLAVGKLEGIDDGVKADDQVHSTTQFPFLAAP
jgi:Domain of unknown function (DUF4331)